MSQHVNTRFFVPPDLPNASPAGAAKALQDVAQRAIALRHAYADAHGITYWQTACDLIPDCDRAGLFTLRVRRRGAHA